MSSPLTIDVRMHEDRAHIHLAGRLTADHVERLSEAFAEAEAAGARHIEVGMSGLEHVDSTGLGALLAMHKRSLDRGMDLTLVALPPTVLKVFRLTNLDKVFVIGEPGESAARPRQAHLLHLYDFFEYSQQILSVLGRGLLGLDQDGRILYTNDAAQRLLGWSDHDLHEKAFHELVAPPSDPALWQSEVLFKDARRQANVYLARGDGGIVQVALFSVVVRDRDEHLGMLVGVTELEDLERTRQELQATQRQLTLIAAGTSDALMMYDIEGNLSFVNEAAVRLTGHPREELQNLEWPHLGAPQRREDWEHVWRSVLIGRNITNRELLLRTAEGRELWCSGSAVSVRESTGRRIGVLLSLRDIDEQRRRHQRAHVLDKFESVGQLMATIGRNLSRVMEWEESLFRQFDEALPEGHPARFKLAELRQVHEYSSNLVGQLVACGLDAELRGDVPARTPEPISVRPVAGAVLDALRARMEPDIEVHGDWGAEPDRVRVDGHDLYQVLFNVCLNAIEAIEGKGEIAIETREAERPGVEGEAAETRPMLRVSVRDSGRGMTPNVRQHAFEPFYTTKPEGLGVGLGLALVHNLVKRNGGFVEINSEPGKFTQVDLVLPRAVEAEGDDPAPTTVPAGRRLLIVDDEPLILNFAAAYLEQQGYAVFKADRGSRALDLYREQRGEIDLVILDLNMPGMNGAQVLEELRSINSEVAVLVATAFGERQTAEVNEHPNTRAVLHKPFRAEELLEAIRRALNENS